MSKSLVQFLFGSKTAQRRANILMNISSKLTWKPVSLRLESDSSQSQILNVKCKFQTELENKGKNGIKHLSNIIFKK